MVIIGIKASGSDQLNQRFIWWSAENFNIANTKYPHFVFNYQSLLVNKLTKFDRQRRKINNCYVK